MLEDHERLAVKSPSSASLPEPAKAMFVPSVKDEPSAGAVINTVGAALAAIVTVITSDPAAAPESVTDAVIV